jgi:phospholipid-translocating ATPase
MALSSYEEPEAQPETTPTKRLRWATQRLKGKKGNKKRGSILGRLNHRGSQNSEKKRDSAGGDSMGTDLGGIQEEPNEDEEEEKILEGDGSQGPRKVYFNIPLPPSAVDEDGHPIAQYRRNKIRTAKYTPISFVPKNIWYQFHNIANVYFLFLIILAVSIRPCWHCTILTCPLVF